MHSEWEYYALQHRFGWTPAEVDAMPAWFVRRCLAVQP